MDYENLLLTIKTDDRSIEARFDFPAKTGPQPCVILCHPHPKYGGNMYNNVLDEISSKLVQSGVGTLRFNYRGVGMSTGEIEGGTGEISDSITVAEFASKSNLIDGSRLGIAGYSFGAWMALEVIKQKNFIKALASISCSQNKLSSHSTMEIVQPKLLMLGDRDHDFPVAQFQFLSSRFQGDAIIEIISQADHFFKGKESIVGEIVSDFFASRL